MVVTLVLILGFITLMTVLYVRKAREWKNGIPGPFNHPFIGSIPTLVSLNPMPHFLFHELSSLFGPIVKIVVGSQNMIILGRYQEVKEAMNHEHLDIRGNSETTNLILHGPDPTDSMSFFNGKAAGRLNQQLQWRELRRFVMKSLRDLGVGKSASEEAILDEATLLIENIHQKIESTDGEVYLGTTLNCAALSVVWNLIGAHRFGYDDENMKALVGYTTSFMHLGKDVIGKPFGSLPFLRHFPPYKAKFDRLSAEMKNFSDYIKKNIQERREKMIIGSPECVIDSFLEKIIVDKSGIFTEQQLVKTCMDVFIAGSETTNKSQEYCIAMMMHRPDVQAKVQAELDSVAQGRKLLTMADQDNLSYTEATLNECWRFCNVAPFGPPRQGEVDVKVGDYTIEAGSQVVYNTYTIHMDENIWKDPQEFNPDRFLIGGKFQPNERLFPFGIGKRRCLGEALARMENFLFFANIMLNFSFSQVGDTPPSLEPEAGFTNGPVPFPAIIKPRL